MTLKHILQGRFMRHPIHPLLVHLPVGLWVMSLIFDIIFMGSGSPAIATASFYVIGVGICGAALAAVTGLSEFIDIPRNTLAWRIGFTHMGLNVVVLALYLIGFFLRGNLKVGSDGVVTGTELVLNILSVGTLAISGYLGGSLVFQHGVGLRPEMPKMDETPSRGNLAA